MIPNTGETFFFLFFSIYSSICEISPIITEVGQDPLLPLGPTGPKGIVVPFVRCLCRRRRTHSFGYYTNMVQQIKLIIHTNIQPPRHFFFTQGQGHR